MDPKLRRVGGPGRGVWITALVLALSPWLASGRAEAQFGFGRGYGYGFGGLYYRSPSVSYINQHSLVTAQAAAANRPQNLTAPRDAYERAEDSGLNQRYNVTSRRGFEDMSPRPRDSYQAPAQTNARAAGPVVPIASFFDKSGHLAWPEGAPDGADLRPKRDAADQAIRSVLDESNRWGSAPITLANEARTKLIDYGKPALEQVRGRSTARVADTFHLFLLSLYESLAQSTVPAAKAARG